jgi:hypothetical protein
LIFRVRVRVRIRVGIGIGIGVRVRMGTSPRDTTVLKNLKLSIGNPVKP